jgi:hypothetical protein
MSETRYELLFSDIDMGCEELGWIERDMKALQEAYGVEDEDAAYRRFLKAKGIVARVHGGYAWVKSD